MNQLLDKKTVREVMNSDVVTVADGVYATNALQLMSEHRTAVLPVVDRQRRCVGIVSVSDFLNIAHDLDQALQDFENAEEWTWDLYLQTLGLGVRHQRLTEIMQPNVVTAVPEESLRAATITMLDANVHRLPVVDECGVVIGVISRTDILQTLAADDGGAIVDHSPENTNAV